MVWLPRLAGFVLCLVGILRLPAVLKPLPVPWNTMVADLADEQAKQSGALLVLGTREVLQPAPPTLEWQLAVERGLFQITESGVAMNFEEDQRIAPRIEKLPLPAGMKAELLRVITRGEQPSRVKSFYIGLTTIITNQAMPGKEAALLQHLDETSRFDRVMVVTATSRGSLYPQQWIDSMIRPLGFEPGETRTVEGNGVRVTVYHRNP